MSRGPSYDFLLGKKTELADIFCEDPDHIMERAMEARIITRRERINLNCVFRPWDTLCQFLDKVMGKGEATCRTFLSVLNDERIVQSYPELLSLPAPPTDVSRSRQHHHQQLDTRRRPAPYRLPAASTRQRPYGWDVTDYECICAARRVERAQSV